MRKKEKKHIIENSNEVPLVNGKREWNVYDVSNSILHHTNEGGTHPSLVLVEYNGKLLLAEVTHSEGKMKKGITNPNENDPAPSFIKRKTVVTKDKKKSKPITVNDLKNKRNNKRFSEEEKKEILKSINSKNVNITNFKLLVALDNDKKKPKK